MIRKAPRTLALAAVVALTMALSGCILDSTAAVKEFKQWASAQPEVLSVQASPNKTPELGNVGMEAYVSIDPSISSAKLITLSDDLWAHASAGGDIQVTVGDAWHYSLYSGGENVRILAALRDNSKFVAGAVRAGSPETVGTVSDASTIADDYTAIVEAIRSAKPLLDNETIHVITVDGNYSIQGTISDERTYRANGGEQTDPAYDYTPVDALGLAQAIIGAGLPVTAAHLQWSADSPQLLTIAVATPEGQAAATAIAADYPTVTLAFE